MTLGRAGNFAEPPCRHSRSGGTSHGSTRAKTMLRASCRESQGRSSLLRKTLGIGAVTPALHAKALVDEDYVEQPFDWLVKEIGKGITNLLQGSTEKGTSSVES